MSKKNWFVVSLLALIIILAGIVRAWGIDMSSMQMDEYFHIATAQSILEGHGGEVFREGHPRIYMRAFLLTLIITPFQAVAPEFAAIPSILFSLISIVLIYLIGSKFSKSVGLIAAYAFAFSTLAVAMGSYIRGYSLFVMMQLALVYALMQIDWSLKGKYSYPDKWFRVATILALPSLYFLADPRSTFTSTIVILLAVPVFFVWHNLRCLKYVLPISAAILAIGFAIVGTVGRLGGQEHVNLYPIYNSEFLGYFFSGLHTIDIPWISLLFTPFFLLGIATLLRSKDQSLKLISVVTFTFLVFYGFYFNRYFEERYIYYLIPFALITFAVGVESLAKKVATNRLATALIIFPILILMLLPFFPNPRENATEIKQEKIEFQEPFFTIQNYNLKVDEQTAFITSHQFVLAYYFDLFKSDRLYSFDQRVPDFSADNRKVLQEYEQGYVVVERAWRTDAVTKANPEFSGVQLCDIASDSTYIIKGWGRSCD
ncbi:MAG: hypothetical protein ACOCXP_00100 [Candidatus Dojkabacteria bacterium]